MPACDSECEPKAKAVTANSMTIAKMRDAGIIG
jgi:hypothetical protein